MYDAWKSDDDNSMGTLFDKVQYELALLRKLRIFWNLKDHCDFCWFPWPPCVLKIRRFKHAVEGALLSGATLTPPARRRRRFRRGGGRVENSIKARLFS